MFSPNINSLDCQPFKWVSWVLVSDLSLRNSIKSILLVQGPFLIPTFELVSWVCAPIISNPISLQNNKIITCFFKSHYLINFNTFLIIFFKKIMINIEKIGRKYFIGDFLEIIIQFC